MKPFAVDDIVERTDGVCGTIVQFVHNSCYPLRVQFPDGLYAFTEDGKSELGTTIKHSALSSGFEVGDTVSAYGVQGIVTRTNQPGDFPIWVEFNEKETDRLIAGFTIDGRHQLWHKEPSLILISKVPKPKKKKEVYQWRIKETSHEPWTIFLSLLTIEEAKIKFDWMAETKGSAGYEIHDGPFMVEE